MVGLSSGLRGADGNQFPRQRFFPVGVSHERWLQSSAISLSDGTAVRIIARRDGIARVEFGLRIDEPLREFLPTRRYFPRSATVGRWLSSSAVQLPAAAAESPAEPPAPEPEQPEEPAVEEPSVERISGGRRDGLIVERGVLGDPEAPALIVEYGDPF